MSKGDTSAMNTGTKDHGIREPWSDSELAQRITRRYRSSPGLISTALFTQMASGALGMAKGARPLLSCLQRLWMPADRDVWPHVSYVWHEGIHDTGDTAPYRNRDTLGNVPQDMPVDIAMDMHKNMPINITKRPGHLQDRVPPRLKARGTATGKARGGTVQAGAFPQARDGIMPQKGETITAPVLPPVHHKAPIHVPQAQAGRDRGAKGLTHRPLPPISPEPRRATAPIRFTPGEEKMPPKTNSETAQTRHVCTAVRPSGSDDTSWPMPPKVMDAIMPKPAYLDLISPLWTDEIQSARHLSRNTGAHYSDPAPLAKDTKAAGPEGPSKTPAHVIPEPVCGTSPARSFQKKPAKQGDMTVTEASPSPSVRSYTGQASGGHRELTGAGARESGGAIPNIKGTTATGHDLPKDVANSHASRILDMPLALFPKRRRGAGLAWANTGTLAIQRMNTPLHASGKTPYTHTLSHPSRMVRLRPLPSCTELSGWISTGETPGTAYITPETAPRTLQATVNRHVSTHTWHADHTSTPSEQESLQIMEPPGKLSSDAHRPFPAQAFTSPDMPLAPLHGPSYANKGNFSPFGPSQPATCSNPSIMIQRTGMIQRTASEAMDLSAAPAYDQGPPDLSSGQDRPDTSHGSVPSWQGQDVEEIASRVYAIIEQRLITERESLGLD